MSGTPSLVIGPIEEPRPRTRELRLALLVLLALALVAIGFVVRDLVSTKTAANGQLTSAPVRAAVLDRASTLAQQAFAYTSATIKDDVAKAAGGMTPDMAKKYRELLTDQVANDIKARGQDQKAQVSGAGMISLTESKARVLALLVQTTTVTGVTNQQVSAERLAITLKKVNGVWLVDGMDPF